MVRLRSKKPETAPTATADPAPGVYPLDDAMLHITNEVCGRCGNEIRPQDEARRTASGDCVHLSC